MLERTLMRWAREVGGKLHRRSVEMPKRVLMNSADCTEGDLFVALRGGRRDGHEFIADAKARGARVLGETNECDIQVPDSMAALRAMGAIHRCELQWVVAITGSMGKTTTRRLVQAAFNACMPKPTLATQGNYNNHLGVPLTLTRASTERQAVLELGANHQGEIDQLARLVRPHVGAITLAGPAHLEGFGGLAGVVKGKGEILDHIEPGGTAVLNRDDAAFGTWAARASRVNVLSFGLDAAADVRGQQGPRGWQVAYLGQLLDLELSLEGDHQIMNALCALAVCLASGLALDESLKAMSGVMPESGRGRTLRLTTGANLIDDSYNANPQAMRAAIAQLLSQSARGIAVLGSMYELGDSADQMHRELGAYCKSAGVKTLVTTDPRIAEGFGPGAQQFDSQSEVAAWIEANTQGADWLLVKGSRGARMERCFIDIIQGET